MGRKGSCIVAMYLVVKKHTGARRNDFGSEISVHGAGQGHSVAPTIQYTGDDVMGGPFMG